MCLFIWLSNYWRGAGKEKNPLYQMITCTSAMSPLGEGEVRSDTGGDGIKCDLPPFLLVRTWTGSVTLLAVTFTVILGEGCENETPERGAIVPPEVAFDVASLPFAPIPPDGPR